MYSLIDYIVHRVGEPGLRNILVGIVFVFIGVLLMTDSDPGYFFEILAFALTIFFTLVSLVFWIWDFLKKKET